ncbi:hypothetical protein PHYPSEUDO_011332 [Phytophthora pseudosyringae]|uniref:Calponin-homology (CH) domain-containing protein n=1 Tax=Phytophthora pseudosyringae TaxID=221518 RepID=A0A8T1WAH1_9STRA|nr:hypothetical protein PHYPSEUDO_011332 [Phytophthora pseudosyringae]
MELSVVTASIDDEETNGSVRQRLLLHWVNSLPLTKCLLVEELRDLRFGDVLYEMVQWLQDNSADAGTAATGDGVSDSEAFGTGEILERLRRVVQFAASECRSRDEDAMYIVNDADCLARVMSGESDAICAVLTVLKRLSVQRMQDHQSSESHKAALRRRREQEKIIEHSLQQENPTEKVTRRGEHKPKRVQTPSSRSRARVNTAKPSKDVRKAGAPQHKLNEKKQSKRKPTTGAKRRLGTGPTAGTAPIAPIAVDKKKKSDQPSIFHDDSGLRVFSMLDPIAKYPSSSEPSNSKCVEVPDSEDARAVRVCNWARLVLQVDMPLEQIFTKQLEGWRLQSPRKVGQLFANGVLLCRIAGAIVHRCGGQLNYSTFKAIDMNFDEFGAVNTPAGRRRSFMLTLSTFKRLGISSEALNSLELLQQREKQVTPKSIWWALDEVLTSVERLARAVSAPNAQNTEESGVDAVPETFPTVARKKKNANHGEGQFAVSPKHLHSPQSRRKKTTEIDRTGCAPLKRGLPYITAEQMHVVNEWLVDVGFDAKKVSGRGVLQDPMRNGVLLCALLMREMKSAPFSYFKNPRTLTEMRENISKAFESLGKHVPPCYVTTSAEQSVLIGDRQVAYGVLWHLWQASQTTFSSGKAKEDVELPPSDCHDTRIAEEVELAGKLSAPVQPSPLLLDIPAVALAGQGKLAVRDDLVTSYQVKLHDTFVRRLAWSENDPNGNFDDDDVFPVPKAPFSSPVYKDYFDPLSMKAHESGTSHSVVDDLLPIRPDGSGFAENSSYDRKIPPRIAIGELSGELVIQEHPSQSEYREQSCTAAVVTSIADPIELTEQGNDGNATEAGAPSPVKCFTSQAQLNASVAREPVEEILHWLKRLGVRLQNASAFHDATASLTEFQSGILLCCIVEKVELMRSLPGITRPTGKQPLSKASALHNITKALNLLQQKKTMPLHLLRRAIAIHAGNRDVILQLLVQIRKAYGHHHHHAPRRRPKHPLSSAA